MRTSSFALFASDTGILTYLASFSTTVGTATKNGNGGVSRNHCDNILWTSFLAESATDAAFLVNVSDSVLHTDGTNRANSSTFSETDTSVSAGLRSAVNERCGTAALEAFVVCFFNGSFAVAIAMDECNEFLRLFNFDAEKCAERVCSLSSAGNTAVGGSCSCSKSRGVIFTAFVSARTAVYTGKASTDCFEFFIFFNPKEVSEQGKEDTCNERDTGYYCQSNKNISHSMYLLMQRARPRYLRIP